MGVRRYELVPKARLVDPLVRNHLGARAIDVRLGGIFCKRKISSLNTGESITIC